MLTGFAFTNPQHTVNHPVYGLDNWIYLAHEGPAEPVIYRDLFGDKGTDLRFAGPARAARRSTSSGRGVRLKPDALEVEAPVEPHAVRQRLRRVRPLLRAQQLRSTRATR